MSSVSEGILRGLQEALEYVKGNSSKGRAVTVIPSNIVQENSNIFLEEDDVMH